LQPTTSVANIYKGQWQGVRDCFRHWWLILRLLLDRRRHRSIPGISASVVDWLAYGHAFRPKRRCPHLRQGRRARRPSHRKAPNNAKEGGALVPTVAFGVPGSATMAILLGAFLIHGLCPGPDMLNHQNLDITYAMVWSVASPNILGPHVLCFSPQFCQAFRLRFSLILPAVLGLILHRCVEATRQWGDLYSLLAFGVIGGS